MTENTEERLISGTRVTLMHRVERAIDYGMSLRGAPYSFWRTGMSVGADGPPPWSADAPPPSPARVRRRGLFCAAVGNLMLRSIGKPPPTYPGYLTGGVGTWGERYPLHRFDLSDLRRGDVLYRPYANDVDQGHWCLALGGANDKVLQSFPDPNGPDCNSAYTARQSHDGGYYKFIIRREDVWG